MDKGRLRRLGTGVLLGAGLAAAAATWRAPPPGPPPSTISYGELMSKAKAGTVASVALSRSQGLVVYRNGGHGLVDIPADAAPADRLVGMGVDVRAVPPPVPGLLSILLSWIPGLLMIGFLIWSVRAASGRGNGPFAMSKTRVKRHDPSAPGGVVFSDVAGIGQAKDDLAEVVQFLRDPARFTAIGARIPKGVLLVGPPGTGKTLLARATAGEAGVPFFSASGSDFVEMFVGVGASRVRDTFETMRKSAPCILFIDEIDAMGRHRGGAGFGNDEREQTLNQMLVEMDGFAASSGVVVIGASNRPDVLDPALLRPGRFDRQVQVPNPDITGRADILLVHMAKVALDPEVASAAAARVLARGTPGFSGADLANLVNEAAILAARHGGTFVTLGDFEEAKDRIMMGAERRSLVMSDEERRLTAYHEAGHAYCAVMEPCSDPVHKATIVPRGLALGLVYRLPVNDRTSLSLEHIEADLTVAMAGRETERMVFGERKITTGAQSDIQGATYMARRMVTEWGFSEKLGAVRYPAEDDASSPYGRDAASPATRQIVDEEVRRIVGEASERARTLLTEGIRTVERIAEALLDRETLDGDEIRAIVAGTA